MIATKKSIGRKTTIVAPKKPAPTSTNVAKGKREAERESRRKWGDELIDAGYTIFPSTLLRRQKALGLEPIHVNILMIMFTYWWRAGDLPFPSKKTMAEAMNIDPSTVRRRIAQMEGMGFIRRIERRIANDKSETNKYDFSGLIKELKPYAKEEMEAKQAVADAKAKRQASKRPAQKNSK